MRYRVLVFCLLIIFMLSGCGKDARSQLLGYWVSSNQNDSISFDEQSKVVINGKYIGEYSVYDEEKIAIHVDTPLLDDVYDISMSASFCVKGNILQIKDNQTNEIYNFYREKHLEKLKNEEYQLLYKGTSCEGYMTYPFSYPDKWDFNLEDTFLEGKIDKKGLEKGSQSALKIANEEIVPLYANSTVLGKTAFVYTCECACILWDEICYEIRLDFQESTIEDSMFLINPQNRYIYTPDDEGIWYLWDGMIKGDSILQYI